MAYSKIILNGETLMDVTSDTVVANGLAYGDTATKNDGTKIEGTILPLYQSGLVVDGRTVTVPAGYYTLTDTSINVSSTTHPNPTAAIASSTGVVTATHTQGTGYVTGGTTTGTLNLTTQAGKTVTPTESAQTAVASYRWTTGPVSVAAISSTYVGTGIARKSSTDTTFASTTGTFTAPVGYYSTAATKTITTQAAATYNTSTTDQTIASNRWLTGTQTIKSVTTTNLTAANIAEGVTVKVGDANNASRITQITGTHSGETQYTATIMSGVGNANYCYVSYNGTKYYANDNQFNFKAGDTLTIYCRGNNFTINGETQALTNYSYTMTLPIGDISIYIEYSSSTDNMIELLTYVFPEDTCEISSSGSFNVYGYALAWVPTGSTSTPAKTITTNPTMTLASTTGVVTATYNGSSSITPTIVSGYVTTANVTAGTVSTTGTSTFQLTSKAAATYNTSTVDQTVPSYRWLTGTQTIKSVTTSNLTAANIVNGVVVKVGDANNASRIAQVTGTYAGIIPTGTSTITSNGTYDVTNYASASVSVAGGSNYGIYYALAQSNNLIASGTTYTPSYTSQEVSAWCDSFSNIGQISFAGRRFTGSFTFNNAKYISKYAFAIPYYGTTIVDGGPAYMDFPQVSYVGQCAFTHNTAIRTFNASSCTSIYNNAFMLCEYLSGISFPKVISIGEQAFQQCSNLITASFPSATNIGSSAFYLCLKLTEVNMPLLLSIKSQTFQSCSSLSIADFPSCTSIGSNAFYGCVSLTSANFPNCLRIESSAFYNCTSLATINFSKCASIGTNAFYGCVSLITVSFPSCTYIGIRAFEKCSALTTISLPYCNTISTSVFFSCIALASVYAPSCSTIGTNAFASCSALTSINCQGVLSIYDYAFVGCTALTTLNAPKCETIFQNAFRSCYNLISLYLNQVSSVPTLGQYAFASTPIGNYSTVAGRFGSVFVPSSLYSNFLTAGNWSSISSRIVSM